MGYFDKELAQMSREQVMQCDADTRLLWFKCLQVKHRELNRVTEEVLHLVHPANETRIVTLIGMTGIGKTTLAKRILNVVLLRFWQAYMTPSDIPYLMIEAPANGDRSISWRTLYLRALGSANEILLDKKKSLKVSDECIVFDNKHYSTLAALRESLELMLEHRNVRLLVIDEALHLLRFESYAAVMDTLKSLASIHETKLMLIGSYDLFELATEYGQVARRSDILHYKRYKADLDDDREEFSSTVKKLQAQWPCADIPNFLAIADELMQATLGSVGLLKALMLSALEMQLKAKNHMWSPRFLQKAAKSVALLNKIRTETEQGELKLEGATFGESMFSDTDVLVRVAQKMGGSDGR